MSVSLLRQVRTLHSLVTHLVRLEDIEAAYDPFVRQRPVMKVAVRQ